MRHYLYFFFVPILASFGCFVAFDYFATPSLHGVFNADIFLFLLIWLLPRKSKFKIALLLGGAATAIFFNPVIGVCILFATATSFIKRTSPWPSVLLLSLFFLFSIVADCAFFFKETFVLNLSQLWELCSFFWWGAILFFLVPLGYTAMLVFFSRNVLWKNNVIPVKPRLFFELVLLILIVNVGVAHFQKRMLFADFPIYNYFQFYNVFKPFDDIEKGMSYVKSEPLNNDTKNIFTIWNPKDSAIIKKKSVFILVESYGVNKDTTIAKHMIYDPFKGSNATFLGILSRKSMHTQGAELEDMGYANYFDSTQIEFISSLKQEKIESWYVHGYVGTFYSRNQKYRQYGFDSLVFIDELKSQNMEICRYGFEGICDSSMINYIDSLLYKPGDKFIFWTTLDSHPPYAGNLNLPAYSVFCKNLSVSEKECMYYSLIENTLKKVAELAQRHPDYQFVIRGDHRPMATIDPEKYYFAWVPMIILN